MSKEDFETKLDQMENGGEMLDLLQQLPVNKKAGGQGCTCEFENGKRRESATRVCN